MSLRHRLITPKGTEMLSLDLIESVKAGCDPDDMSEMADAMGLTGKDIDRAARHRRTPYDVAKRRTRKMQQASRQRNRR